MASTIVTKNSSTASAVPVSGDLTQGELAVNVTDKKLYTKNSGGTVVELGTTPTSLTTGAISGTTLAASGAVTLSGGTANGVAYLNGSKVLTTGSALTFDGTNLGIGTSSPSSKLHAYNASGTNATLIVKAENQYANQTASFQNISTVRTWDIGQNLSDSSTGSLEFYDRTGGATRMRIDSSGNLLVGTTSRVTTEKVSIEQTADGPAIIAVCSNATQSASGIVYARAARNTTNNSFYAYSYYNTGAGAFKFVVADSGNVTNTNNSYGAISDAKLKENVTDATPKLEKLNQVRIVNFNMIGDEQKQLGVIAQELEQIFPGMVDESPDRDAEGNDLGTTTKSVKYSVFVPMLIKAMQEQQALITQLTERITALEGK